MTAGQDFQITLAYLFASCRSSSAMLMSRSDCMVCTRIIDLQEEAVNGLN